MGAAAAPTIPGRQAQITREGVIARNISQLNLLASNSQPRL
nr:MAG TPA: hypothetical protein [Caudoviricetes sp.]